jgi:hypothetical protein
MMCVPSEVRVGDEVLVAGGWATVEEVESMGAGDWHLSWRRPRKGVRPELGYTSMSMDSTIEVRRGSNTKL